VIKLLVAVSTQTGEPLTGVYRVQLPLSRLPGVVSLILVIVELFLSRIGCWAAFFIVDEVTLLWAQTVAEQIVV
jgi:hypothetical protein